MVVVGADSSAPSAETIIAVVLVVLIVCIFAAATPFVLTSGRRGRPYDGSEAAG